MKGKVGGVGWRKGESLDGRGFGGGASLNMWMECLREPETGLQPLLELEWFVRLELEVVVMLVEVVVFGSPGVWLGIPLWGDRIEGSVVAQVYIAPPALPLIVFGSPGVWLGIPWLEVVVFGSPGVGLGIPLLEVVVFGSPGVWLGTPLWGDRIDGAQVYIAPPTLPLYIWV